MSKFVHLSLSTFATCLLLLAAPSAHAQLMMDQSMSMPVGGQAVLGAASRAGFNPSIVMNRLQQMGYTDIAPSPTNPDTFQATTPDGQVVLLNVDPATGQIVSATAR